MKVYDDTRDAIYVKLKDVPSIGRVFPHLRFASDLTTFEDLYTVPHPLEPSMKLMCVCWVTRVTQVEEPSWTDNDLHAAITVTSRWRITLLYGFEDDEDTERASETLFQRLVDSVLEEFRFDETLGDATGVLRAWPLELLSANVGRLEGGDQLCHRAEFSLRVEHLINS